MDLLTFLPATLLGYKLFNLVTDEEKSRIARKIPQIKVWRLQISPSIRIFVRGRIIHLHHWLSLSILLTFSIFLNMGFLDYMFTKGLMFGGVIQGLTFPDFKDVFYRNDYRNNTSIPSTTKVSK